MNQEQMQQLSDEELKKHAEKTKNYHIYDAVIIGVLIGVAIYSSVMKGFGLLTFVPLVYLPAARNNKRNREALHEELRRRNMA